MKKVRGHDLNYVLEIRKARRRTRLRAVLLGLAFAIAGAWFVATHERRGLLREIDERRVVILPFDNRTDDPALDALGTVVSDWTTRLLTFFHNSVDVVPTTTTLAYHRATNLIVHEQIQRAEFLAIGVRAQRVAWGTFYQFADSLRFSAYISDIAEGGAPRQVARIVVPATQTMRGVDQVAKTMARSLLRRASLERAESLAPPPLQPYSAFVNGLDYYAQGDYHSAVLHLSNAMHSGDARRVQIWLADALLRDRDFARADSVLDHIKRAGLPVTDAERAYMISARLHGDWEGVHSAAEELVDQLRADDLAALDFALASLALNRPRQARTIMLRQHPNRGALRSRPDFYLHLAAAHHLSGEHDRERRMARRALFIHPTSVEAKLALCRAEAVRSDEADATAAVDRLAAVDAGPGSTITTAAALRECSAELRAHELPRVATHADHLAAVWERRRPTPPPVRRDPVYEQAYFALAAARSAAERGNVRQALEQLWFALDNGLPYYEPGRLMLHAEPAFRRLRNTRGFIRLTQPQG